MILKSNLIQDEGAAPVLQVLPSSVTALDLSSNQLLSGGHGALAEVVGRLSHLQELHLSGTLLTELIFLRNLSVLAPPRQHAELFGAAPCSPLCPHCGCFASHSSLALVHTALTAVASQATLSFTAVASQAILWVRVML